MAYYSAIKRNTFESVLMRWINLEHYHTEWSKSEREKQISYINTYMWNLEKCYSVRFSSVTQSCPTLCNPVDCSPPGSSNPWDSPGNNTLYSSCSLAKYYRTLVTPWTVDCQAPPSMEFSSWEYWRKLPFPTPGDLSDPWNQIPYLLNIQDRLPAICEDHLIYSNI